MQKDFFLFDSEQLKTLASTETIKQGLAYFSEDRVFSLEVSEVQLTAQVIGVASDQAYWVELRMAEDQSLHCHCECQSPESVCKHGVAVLYSYMEYCSNKDQIKLTGAIERAIKDRIKKGRNEVQVNLLSGNLAFGIWEAKSIISATYRKAKYQVHIRSLDERKNYCTCPDLASNQLGTCKHIEAVLHYAKKQPDYQDQLKQGSLVSFVYLAWESATDPVLRLHQSEQISPVLAKELKEYFDINHRFKGRLPDDFNFFCEKFKDREDFVIGEDAISFVRQSASDVSQKLRAQEINRQILQADGVPGIKTRLFPFQTEGVAFLASRGRAMLADDMGLGKTLQSIAAATWLSQFAGVDKVLIICPSALKYQWAREIEKFTGLPVQIIQGSSENRQVQYKADVLFFIVNYELVLRDLAVISESLSPDLLILDEAQRIKDWRTKIASTVKLITTRYVFVLTGSPLENRIEDLYSLLQVIDPRVLGPLWRCLLDFHVTDENGTVIGYKNLSELRQRISSVMLRRNRNQVIDQLPERIEVRVDVPMLSEQQAIHNTAISTAKSIANLGKKRALKPDESNQLLVALQQAKMVCNALGLIDQQTQGSPKLDELERLLEELCLHSSRKVVVFSQWTMMTEFVESLTRSMGLGSVRLYGAMTSESRAQLRDKFLTDAALQVLISTDQGAHDLTFQGASALIHLDKPWSPVVFNQRIATVHSLGQKNKVQVFLLLSESSYEQQAARLVTVNGDLFADVMSPETRDEVVNWSNYMVQSIIDDLTEQKLSSLELTVEDDEQKRSADSFPVSGKTSGLTTLQFDQLVQHTLEKIKKKFTTRIEQVLASHEGLLVVVNEMVSKDEEIALKLSEDQLVVVVIDAKTMNNLSRLKAASPVADVKVIFGRERKVSDQINPLIKIAQDKLRSAQVLVEQNCFAGVMELLASSMLAVAAFSCGKQQIPTLEQATVWLYKDILPQQVMTTEQIANIGRVVALNQNLDVPEILIRQAVSDAKVLLAQFTG